MPKDGACEVHGARCHIEVTSDQVHAHDPVQRRINGVDPVQPWTPYRSTAFLHGLQDSEVRGRDRDRS